MRTSLPLSTGPAALVRDLISTALKMYAGPGPIEEGKEDLRSSPLCPAPWNCAGGGIIGSFEVDAGIPTISVSTGGKGGGSSPFIEGVSSLSPPPPMCGMSRGSKGDIRPRPLGVIGDFGVLPPDCEVEVSGEGGGLSPSEEEDMCGGFMRRSSTPLASCIPMLIGDEVSALVPMGAAARVISLVHVTMSVLSSV